MDNVGDSQLEVRNPRQAAGWYAPAVNWRWNRVMGELKRRQRSARSGVLASRRGLAPLMEVAEDDDDYNYL